MKFEYRKQTPRPLQCDKICIVTFVSFLYNVQCSKKICNSSCILEINTNFDLSESHVTVVRN